MAGKTNALQIVREIYAETVKTTSDIEKITSDVGKTMSDVVLFSISIWKAEAYKTLASVSNSL